MGNINRYSYNAYRSPVRPKRRKWPIILGLLVLLGVGYAAFSYFSPKTVEEAAAELQFDSSVSDSEKQIVRDAIQQQSKTYRGTVTTSINTALEATPEGSVLMAYVPVSNVYASRQSITAASLKDVNVFVPAGTEDTVRAALAGTLQLEETDITVLTGTLEDISREDIAFIPADQLASNLKLLTFEGTYYLDSFTKGGVFRQVTFSGSDAGSLAGIKLNNLAAKDTTLKVNMSGVTALTRLMMKKLASVKDPLYFSANIGDFLSDADITHVSNEVSFKTGCTYSNALFCSPPEFIETLKDSGVDLVELTGNHNNDVGSTYNTDSINQYHSLNMATFGGGLNTSEAAKPHIADQKGSKITFIGYNMADGPNSGAIAGTTSAGANYYTEAKAKADITAAKANSQFVVVNIQYSECQAYPSGYVEYPQCDGPIGGQQTAFRKMIDLGADMVVGSSAHQPQTYELYEGKPIYYGLGNLYFDQINWPGTERGIILTHYFMDGKLLQTKLTPTVYDESLQTEVMDEETAVYLLDRLHEAR